jgi:predicted lipoprotein
MKKLLKYTAGIILMVVLAYNSVYFRKLDAMKASSSKFDAKAFARNYFNNKLIPSLSVAVEINQLISLLESNKEQTFERYGHALGIGNIRYFLVKGEGQITSINENDITILAKADTATKSICIATEFVFGNAIRDASGKIDINEFSNTMDFNSVSSEINKIVRAKVLPAFKASVKKGNTVQFAGAVELNKEHLNVDDIELMPAQLKIVVTVTK